MTTAPDLFDDDDRLKAFAHAVSHADGVRDVTVRPDDGVVDVTFGGHKSAVPLPIRDLAKSLCLKLPAPGNQRYRDSDDFRHVAGGPDDWDDPLTVATFRIGGALKRNQR